MRFVLLILYLSFFSNIFTQTLYDDCLEAYFIGDSRSWCVSGLDFNIGVSSGSADYGCMTNDIKERWFTFIAFAPGLLVEVFESSGTLLQLQLLEGNCESLVPVACTTVPEAGGQTRILTGNLVAGRKYHLRIGSFEVPDSFSICMNNFFSPPINANDLKKVWELCSKETFVVNKLDGFGEEQEMIGATCFSAIPPMSPERNSSWLKWTCDKPGILTFVLEPLLWNDDLDFVVYRMGEDPMGNDMELVRCMASGVISSNCTTSSRCCGPTGLKIGEVDVSESSGCGLTSNNFLMPLNMTVGETYILVVNNYTSGNQGYKISFGGDATFVGAKANFEIELPTLFCQDKTFKVNNLTVNGDSGPITQTWIFSPDAVPSFSDLPDKIEVIFETPGMKVIALEVQNAAGCRTTHVDSLLVPCCSEAYFADIGNGLEVQEGTQIVLEGNHNLPGVVRSYSWTPASWFDCPGCPKVTSIPLEQSGFVAVEIQDNVGCMVTDSIYLRLGVHNIFTPNIFTPNNDGINDRFSLYGNRFVAEILNLRIFNRWGVLVYEASNLLPDADRSGWDGSFRGKNAPEGVYVYVARVKLSGGDETLLKGSFTLMR